MADYTLSAKLTADGSGFSKVFKDAFNQSEKLSSGVKNTGKEITGFGKNMTLTGAGMTAGFTMPFVKAIQTTGDFEAAMTKAGVIAGATSGELGQMTDAALELGATTSLSSNEVAEAMTEMAAKGFDATQVIAAMPGVISAAEASGEDLALTADVVASALNGFGLEAGNSGKVADILAMAANKTAAGVGDMGEAFKYSAPLASSLGISMEELSAATGLMVDAGLGGGQAGTTLRQALISLTKPTAKSANLMADLGFSAVDAQGNFKSLEQIVAELNGSMKGMTEAQKLSALATIFGTEAASGMNILLSAGQEELAGLTKELENSEGASAEAAKAMKDNLNGVLDNLGGAIESATISIMSKLTPFIADVASFVTEMVEKFNNLSDGAQTMIGVGALIVAALGPVLTILGVMTMGIGGLVTAFGFLISPIGLAIAAVVGVAAAFGIAMAKSEGFRNAVFTIGETLKTIGQIVRTFFTDFSKLGELNGVLQEILPPSVAGAIWSGLMSILHPINDLITGIQTIASIASGAITTISGVEGALAGAFGEAGTLKIIQIGMAIKNVKDTIVDFVSSAIPVLQSAFEKVAPIVLSAISNIGPQIGAVFSTIWGIIQAVIPVFTTLFTSIMSGFQSAGGAGSGFAINLSTILLGVSPLIKGIIFLFQNFGPQITAAFQQVATMLIPIVGTIGAAFGQLVGAIIPLVMQLMSSLIPVIMQVGTTFMSIIAVVLPVVISLFNQLVPIIMQVVLMFANIIAQVVPLVGVLISALLPVIQSVIETFMNIVTAVAPAFISIIQLVMSVLNALVPVFMAILTAAIQVFAGVISAISPIVAFIGGIISTIMAIISPIVSFVAGIISSIVGVITPLITIVSGVFSTIFTVVSGIFRNIMTFIGGAINSISGIISGLSGVVSGVFNTIFGTISRVMGNVSSKISGVFEAIKSSWNGLTSFVSGVFSGISGAVSQLVGQVKGFVNGVIGGINSAVSLINKIPGVSIGSIPYLARGTDDFQGGFARINEGGRGELVSMPGGTQVIPHDVSMRYAREAGKQSSVSNAIDSKSKVMIPNENSKQSMNLTLNMGSKSFRGFVDDISNTQNAQIQLTESYL